MICNQERMERLYLSKGDQDIYIDNCKIPQHHIDGIRFLYRQFKKKKPGVIVNYRAEYARNLQIVLFLKAIHSLLKKPVLILCKEGTEHNWMEQFQKWTDFYDEVVLETQKPFIKKLILINTMLNLPVFSRREWSVVIVDDDETAYQVLKFQFIAEYKIYNTSVNMKENLDTFSQVYKWLHPEEAKEKGKWKFNKNDFISDNRHNVRERINKAILLDAFMEDIVATNDTTIFCSEELKTIGQDICNSPPIVVSRKNKDATGTKIKRSRRIIDDNDDDIPLSKTNINISLAKDSSTIESDTDITKESNKVIGDINLGNECNKHNRNLDLAKESNEVKRDMNLTKDSILKSKLNFNERLNTTFGSKSSDENEDFSMEKFNNNINTKKYAITKLLEDPEEDIKTDDLNNESEPNMYYEPDSVIDINSDRFYEMDTLVFSDQINGDQVSNINEPITKNSNLDRDNVNAETNIESNEICKFDTKSKGIQDKNICETDERLALKTPTVYDEINPEHDEFEINRNYNNGDIKSNMSCEDSPSIYTDFNSDNNEIELKINSSCIKEKHFEVEDKAIDKSCRINEDKVNDNINPILNENKTELDQNEFIDSTNIITKKIDTQIVNVLKRNCIEDEIKEMEEKALKKFKGSILDNLF